MNYQPKTKEELRNLNLKNTNQITTMNENLNLVEILKDCPSGTKLYSTIFGDVKFEEINENRLHPIIVRIGDGHIEYFTAYGKNIMEFITENVLYSPQKSREIGANSMMVLKQQMQNLILKVFGMMQVKFHKINHIY